MKDLKVGDLVYLYDDETKHPYKVHDIFNNQVSLGLMEYPDVEQDDYINIADIRKFETNDELLLAKDIIHSLLN